MGELAEYLLRNVELGNHKPFRRAKNYACPFCTKRFVSRQGQVDHTKMKHPTELQAVKRAVVVNYLLIMNSKTDPPAVRPDMIDELEEGIVNAQEAQI